MAYIKTISEMKNMSSEQWRQMQNKKTQESVITKIENEGKEILKQFPHPIIPIGMGDPVWKQLFEVHRELYILYYKRDERMFIYHLGLANLAALMEDVSESDREVVQQCLVYLHFGENRPHIVWHMNSILETVLSCNKRKNWKECDSLDSIRQAVVRIGNFPVGHITLLEGESLIDQYIDGCIRIISLLVLSTSSKQYDVPEELDEKRGRNKTLGDYFDDYFTNLFKQ